MQSRGPQCDQIACNRKPESGSTAAQGSWHLYSSVRAPPLCLHLANVLNYAANLLTSIRDAWTTCPLLEGAALWGSPPVMWEFLLQQEDKRPSAQYKARGRGGSSYVQIPTQILILQTFCDWHDISLWVFKEWNSLILKSFPTRKHQQKFINTLACSLTAEEPWFYMATL